MKLLFSSTSSPELGLLKSLLDEAGIEAEIRNESTYASFPAAAFQPEIWVVKEEDYAEACNVRDAWRKSGAGAVEAEGAEATARPPRFVAVCFGLIGLSSLAVAMWSLGRSMDSGDRRDAVRFVFLALIGIGSILGGVALWLRREK